METNPLKKYSLTVLKYVSRLYENNIYTIPINSFGQDIRKAKAPLIQRGTIVYTFNVDDELRNRLIEYTEKTIELLKRGRITAYGLPCANNYFLCLDIDAYKNDAELASRMVDLARKGVYVERTASGGYHVIARVGRYIPRLVIPPSNKVKIDNKTYGYVIAHPSILVPYNGLYTYRKIEQSPELYEEIATYEEVADSIEEALNIGIERGGEQEDRAQSIKPKEDNTPRLFKISCGDPLKCLEIIRYVLSLILCDGMVKAVESLVKGEYPVPYTLYGSINPYARHSRSTWTVLEYNIGAIMYVLGFDEESATIVADYIDGVAEAEAQRGDKIMHPDAMASRTSTKQNILAGYKYHNWGLDQRGGCMLASMGLCNISAICTFNPVTRLISKRALLIRTLRRKAIDTGVDRR